MLNYNLPRHLKTQYATAYPFPHIVIDNFMNELYLKKAVSEIPFIENWEHDKGEEEVAGGEHQFRKLYLCSGFPEYVNNVLAFMNSTEVLIYLEELTGIKGLIPDPSYYGGGIHRIKSEGKLSVHVDYNYHPVTKLHRRLNLLLYLNKDWKKEWGGDLQLWTSDLKTCVKKIEPIFNRAVIFSISDKAYHGHPGPLKTPENVDRLSFALYYFTKERPIEEITEPHMALFKHV